MRVFPIRKLDVDRLSKHCRRSPIHFARARTTATPKIYQVRHPSAPPDHLSTCIQLQSQTRKIGPFPTYFANDLSVSNHDGKLRQSIAHTRYVSTVHVGWPPGSANDGWLQPGLSSCCSFCCDVLMMPDASIDHRLPQQDGLSQCPLALV